MIDLDGVRRLISRELLDEVAVGDYVIVHVGYALSRLNEEEAQRTLGLLRQGGLAACPADPEAAGP
jgi:hydrogenase expression/formation protein HypC